MQQHHVWVFGADSIKCCPDRLMIVEVGATRKGDLGTGGEHHLVLGALAGGNEVAAVDHCRGQRLAIDHRA